MGTRKTARVRAGLVLSQELWPAYLGKLGKCGQKAVVTLAEQ